MEELVSAQAFGTNTRRKLAEELPTDAEFDAFVLDHYPDIYRRFSGGMERIAKENLLLSSVGNESVLINVDVKNKNLLIDGTQLAVETKLAPRRWSLGLIVSFAITSICGFCMLVPNVNSKHESMVIPSTHDGMVCLTGGYINVRKSAGLETILVKPFCIDTTLVTQERYMECAKHGDCADVNSVNYTSPVDRPYVEIYSALCTAKDPEKTNHPINCIDWNQAADFCRYDHNKRLPTEAEWIIAAGGQHGWTYPWGMEAPSPQRLNACDKRCTELANRHRTHWIRQPGSKSNVIATQNLSSPSEQLMSGDDGWESTSDVRSKPTNLHGLFDMAGNLRQFTSDTKIVCRDGKCDDYAILKGGSWNETRPAHVEIKWQAYSPVNLRSEMHGFRCAISL